MSKEINAPKLSFSEKRAKFIRLLITKRILKLKSLIQNELH